jgi:putative CocE/NonD family hydrolase
VGVNIDFDVPATMRDGVVLRANVYRPADDGLWPVLLTRTPYSKDAPLTSATFDPVRVAAAGFIVVVQDTRGRFASEGEWCPFDFERKDGYDSVEWAARLPGSNGRVCMYGGSYCGSTQWLAAVEQPPSLAAIAPLLTWCDPLDGLFARGGALELGLVAPWTLVTGLGQVAKAAIPADQRLLRTEALFDDYDNLAADGYWGLPASDLPVVRRHGVPDLGSLSLPGGPDDPISCRVKGEHHQVVVPTLHIGGWYDLFLQGTLDNYMAMSALGRPANLVVGPWSHGDPLLASRIGVVSFGIRANGIGAPISEHGDVNDLQLAWFRQHLDPDADGLEREPAVRVFVMGRNEWRSVSTWPPQRARDERWYLCAGGRLQPHPPAAQGPPTRFAYDPDDPVPTLGGAVEMAAEFPAGPFDQAPIEQRSDVCVFTSEPLAEDLEVAGRVRVVLEVQSSARSADWVARLCDVLPDGRSINLCDGIVRIGNGADARTRAEIDLWSTWNVFRAGHRLRVHVTSSCFPRWDRNVQLGDPGARRASQVVYHDADRPSWIELPVIRA